MSLYASPVIPRFVANSLPFVLLACVVVMIHANVTKSTNIRGTISVGTLYESKQYHIFDFAMWTTVKDMWDSKAYLLSILIGAWSGSWPYIKIVMLYVVWFVPPSHLSLNVRRTMMRVLSILAKWALVDIFLLVMFDVAFRFHVPFHAISFDLTVQPGIGSYTFISATIVIIATINLVEFYERNATGYNEKDMNAARLHHLGYSGDWFSFVRCPTKSWFERGRVELANDLDNEDDEAFMESFGHKSIADLSGLGWYTKVLLAAVLIGCIVLILVGAVANSFSFHYLGISGEALEILQPESVHVHYSLVNLIHDLSASVTANGKPMALGTQIGIAYIQVCFLLFALVMPMVQICMVLVVLFFPFSLRDAKIFLYATRVVMSLSALDAFSISVVVSVSQLDRFSLFLQKDKQICTVLKNLLHMDCFRVDTELLPGCWMLFGASFLVFFIVFLILRQADNVLAAREKRVLDLIDERQAM